MQIGFNLYLKLVTVQKEKRWGLCATFQGFANS